MFNACAQCVSPDAAVPRVGNVFRRTWCWRWAGGRGAGADEVFIGRAPVAYIVPIRTSRMTLWATRRSGSSRPCVLLSLALHSKAAVLAKIGSLWRPEPAVRGEAAVRGEPTWRAGARRSATLHFATRDLQPVGISRWRNVPLPMGRS